ncbi:unnamed protein product, partial [Rotaria magnacalcarata]
MNLIRNRRAATTRGNVPPKLVTSGQLQTAASFAQQRIWLHEQLYFEHQSSSLAIYNILVPIKIKHGSLPVERIRLALLSVLDQHMILRTSVRFNDKSGQLEQQVQPISHDLYSFEHTLGIRSLEQLEAMLTAESVTNHFNLDQGKVLRCHIMHIGNDDDDHMLHEDDLLVFSIHHIAFDISSIPPFLTTFTQACKRNKFTQAIHKEAQYIDFTLYEQSLLKDPISNRARHFWMTLLHGYNWANTFLRSLASSQTHNETRSGRSFSKAFTLDQHIVQAQMAFASSHNITMFQLCLSCYFLFIYTSGAGEDLCITSAIDNRRLFKNKTMVGMFVNLIPYRIQLDPQNSFSNFVLQVQRLCSSINEHSHLPYQHMLNLQDNEQHRLSHAFFSYESLMSSVNYSNSLEFNVNDENKTVFVPYNDRDRSHDNGVALFDFTITMSHSHQEQSTECYMECSRDLFNDPKFIQQLADRFRYMLEQLFVEKKSDVVAGPMKYLSLLLPSEINEMELTTFGRISSMNEGRASFAQERIWLDERVRFNPDKPQLAIYNMPFLYHIESGTMSIVRLRHALQLVVKKHQALRTALFFDSDKKQLMQRIVEARENEELFAFCDSEVGTDDKLLMKIMYDERGNPFHFDLTSGRVCRLHVVRRNSNRNSLQKGDAIIFNFHHAIFDFPSMLVFQSELDRAYTTGQLELNDESELRYIDYSIAEREMPMSMAYAFWLEALCNYAIDQPLSLPFDRYRLSDEQRTGRGVSVSFHFGQELSSAFLIYARMSNTTLEQLSLACYYVFLFKLTNGEQDLCVGMNIDGRYKDELHPIIGMFANAIPLRLPHLDPCASFSRLIEQVREMITRTVEMSYFPLQRILGQHPNCVTTPAFLDTSFEYTSTENSINQGQVSVGEVMLTNVPYSIQVGTDETVSKFDFSLRLQYDKATEQLSYQIDASLDLFDKKSVQAIGRRFYVILQQLFLLGSFDVARQPIYELSLLLSDEVQYMESINNINTQMNFESLGCLKYEFLQQASTNPQKISVCLDEQSLSYAELLAKVYELVVYLGKRQYPNEIICQCVERSIEMIIGQLAIVVVGACYCALSPGDPPVRLATLLTRTKANTVLVHPATVHLFTTTTTDQHVINLYNCFLDDANSTVVDTDDNAFDCPVFADNLAYIIFTSGSTGEPKVVQITHRNLSACISSFKHLEIVTHRDNVVQMAQCSFDAHILECLGMMMLGATLILLHPHGNMDFEYLSSTLEQHQVTFFSVVPSFMNALLDHLMDNNRWLRLSSIRSFGFLGEAIINSNVAIMGKLLDHNKVKFYNLYGPAECTLGCVYHRVSTADIQSGGIPIGVPFPGMQAQILDQYYQPVFVGQVGELFLDGVQRFPGYYERHDLTAQSHYGSFYRTGDLVRQDPTTRHLYYLGRQDFQIKLRGQRIELGEIERCLLELVSGCVVVKCDEHLVAYVQGKDIDLDDLRAHCRLHLPQFMIPSIFIPLERFPLNKNGKLDRLALPKPTNLSSLSNTIYTELHTEMEETVHKLWCQVLQSDVPKSTTSNFFSMGGHSMLLMQLYHQYQSLPTFDNRISPITLFFRQPTIGEHAMLLQHTAKEVNGDKCKEWQSMHLTEAPASFAQERIYLDQHVRFSSGKHYASSVAAYNELNVLKIVTGTVSILRLRRAIRWVLTKHLTLRTSFDFATERSMLIQSITQTHHSFDFTPSQTIQNDNHLQDLLSQTNENPSLFNLTSGHVFICQLLQRQHSNSNVNNEFLAADDMIVIGFHHIAFDRTSRPIFLRDLTIAYNNDAPLPIDSNMLQYIDYATHERELDMTVSRDFWRAQLNG